MAVADPRPRWIVNARYDLGWFFGGAAAAAGVAALCLGAGVSVVVLWWIWLIGFDGPHIGAAFTRTYLDRREWRSRPGVLLLALLAFALGPACLALNQVTRSDAPFQLFLGGATLYGYYHVVRQHYGFLALYKAVGGERDRTDLHVDRWTLYAACWAPYVAFLLTHPRARALIGLAPDGPRAAWEDAAVAAAVAAWIGAVALFLVRARAGARRAPNGPKVAYWLVVALSAAGIYFAVAQAEPVYDRTRGPDEDFLLISILNVLPHNVQYLGLVWFHNRNRYGRGGDFGPARWLNASLGRYLAGCAIFSAAAYLLSACATNVFPGCSILPDGRIGPVTSGQIGLSLWWGLAIHHYYIDQQIWRIRGDAELKRNLGLPP